jgi:type III pantothenate kinase
MSTLLTADVGNSRIKIGRFEFMPCASAPAHRDLPIAAPALPEPDAVGALPIEDCDQWADVLTELIAGASPQIALASVNRPVAERLKSTIEQMAAERGETWMVSTLTYQHVPLAIAVDEPERVGIDRLCGALAADRLRRREKPAIVIDLGTAIKVDLVTADGVFQGGAILPGIAMSARALHEQTDLLPLIEMPELDVAQDAVGRNTQSAMQAGLYWGAVGAIRELIARQRDRLAVSPQVFLTGGAAPSVATLVGGPDYTVRFVPHLVLSGIAFAAEHARICDD